MRFTMHVSANSAKVGAVGFFTVLRLAFSGLQISNRISACTLFSHASAAPKLSNVGAEYLRPSGPM